ncbi:MAG TPA: alpha/beta fold hydrolase [Sandaracinaceae bacterium LLY-WYZ-13_1]|nr:alpha/beta fold hydrolase [Sandaracinaceae bacterium LLY-WYZ-13_1]
MQVGWTLRGLLAGLVLGGCHYLGPGDAPIHARVAPAGSPVPTVELHEAAPGSDCLLVLLPGIGDGADRFAEVGFLQDAARARAGCDVALADARFSHYVAQQVEERLGEVLRDARRRGYRSIWLVGVSLGGYGAVLTARAHPSLVDGLVLLAPMLGVPPREADVVREVRAAGGLRAWPGVRGAIPPPRHHFREPRLVWDWLHDAVVDPRRAERVVLAYGEGDRLADRHGLLADALPDHRVFRRAGAHDWGTWRALWRRVLRAKPWTLDAPSAPGAVAGASPYDG